MRKYKQRKWRPKLEAVVLSEWLRAPWEASKLWKNDGVVHCSVENAAVSCVNQRERLTQYWASPSEERRRRRRRRKKNNLAVLLLFGWVLSWRFLAPLGVLLVMKTLEDEQYVVIKAFKFTVFEIWRDFNVLSYIACPRYPYIRVYRLYD